MKIDRVVFCLNSSPLYSGMWDIVSEVYIKNTDFIPTLIFCGTQEELDNEVKSNFDEVFLLPKYEEVICNPSLDWSVTWTAFWAIANMFPDEVCLFSGIDEIPISDRLWNKLSDIPDDKYVVGLGSNPYRTGRHIASGSNCAKGKVLKKVLDIEDDLKSELKKIWNNRSELASYVDAWNAENMGWWGLDEACVTSKVHDDSNVVFLDNAWVAEYLQSRKIDRGSGCAYDPKKLKEKYYWCAHIVRPLSDPSNKEKVLQLLEDMEIR